MFGDYYYFGDDHDPKYDEQHGFWFRRIYLTYDHNLSSRFATRLRRLIDAGWRPCRHDWIMTMTAPHFAIAARTCRDCHS